MDLQSTEVLDLAILSDATTAVTGSLTGAKAGLFKNDVLPARTSVAADLVEADYAGYATQAITWHAPSRSDDGEIEIVGTMAEFRPTDGTVPNEIHGLFIEDAAGLLLAGGRFEDAPLPMNGVLDTVIPTIRFRLTSGGVVVTVS